MNKRMLHIGIVAMVLVAIVMPRTAVTQTYDPDPSTAGAVHNILLENADEDGQGGSGSTLPLRGNTLYEFRIKLPNDVVRQMSGRRRWVIIYRRTGALNADCESTQCWRRIKLFSSADTGAAVSWRYRPQQNERVLITHWSPSAETNRSGESDRNWRVDGVTFSSGRRGSRIRFTASSQALVPNAISDVYVVKSP